MFCDEQILEKQWSAICTMLAHTSSHHHMEKTDAGLVASESEK